MGRFGSALALELVRLGTEVLAVDSDATIAQRLAGQINHIVVADTTNIDALREVGVPDFNRAVVGIGSDMQASILTTSLLSELEIPDVWAKATSAEHARILKRVGAHHVVMPEHDIGQRVAHLVSDQMLDYLEVDADWVLVKTQPPRDLCGEALDHARLQRKGVAIVSVKPAGATSFEHVGEGRYLSYGDEIVVVGATRDVDRFMQSR